MKNIPYGHQSIYRGDIEEVVKILKSDWVTQGPKITEFERALCDYAGAKYAVVVSSGTAALHVASLAIGLKRGDEIITSPITFLASSNCALYCGARPIFADIKSETANINTAEIAKKITRRTKLLIPVHFAGYPCDLADINAIARRNNLFVIEDAAHALGAKYKGTKIGSCRYSDMTIFSFHPVKTITTGEGGVVLTNNKKLYQSLLLLRNHGITKDRKLISNKAITSDWYYEMRSLGFNYRMTDIQAALGISQLKKADYFIERRRKIACNYDKAFNTNPFFDVPIREDGFFSAHHLYPIKLKGSLKLKRDKVFALLRNQGIGVQVHYIPVYLQPYYQGLGFKKGMCPHAEDYYEREISLPIYPAMTTEQVKCVIDKVFEVFDKI